MKLIKAVNEYIEYRRGLGIRGNTDAQDMKALCRVVGAKARVENITEKQIETFFAGKCCGPRSRKRKYYSLRGFERFAVRRGYIVRLPVGEAARTGPPTFVPYILGREELRRLFDAIPLHRRRVYKLQTLTERTVLLLLYRAGLRISEAISLNLADVDLSAALLTVRDTKFYKTRLVPLGPQLNRVMSIYAKWRMTEGYAQDGISPFFVVRSGARLKDGTVRKSFRRLRNYARICRPGGQRPRLHDLRHSFAVHRLVAWYQQGADVQRLLPKLVVYLGHVRLSSTQVYLTMTPDLLQQASARFEKYAASEVCHE